ncbi:uncharacterized protein LOC126748451 [Anthonomus grandis grandis]|uniref:uncharacterized protein LOC126748451 n=1 Tax=Anthonomus grandis grandis TaxID=2921223 RepID=UPI00216641A4|nr:uncharacterized protein LOC126748451 [Anthonomus grandis grandis]
MTEQLEALVKERGIYKGKITKIINWYNKSVDTETNYMEFEVRLDSLTQAFNKYEDVQMKIEIIDSTNEDKDSVDDKYYSCLAKLKTKIKSLCFTQNRGQTVPNETLTLKPNVNLPQLSIPQFCGELTKWNAFYQLFNTLIVNNHMLTNIEKLIYLKSYLKGEPLHLIETLQLTDCNLEIAIDTLKQRYDNQLSIIFAHIKNLVEIPSLTKVNAQTVRDFIVQIKQNIDSLKNLAIPVEHWDLMLIYLFSQKLDFGTRKAYISDREMQTSNSQSATFPKLDDLLTFLECRCSVLENLSEPLAKKASPLYNGPPLERNTSSQPKIHRYTHLVQDNNREQGRTQSQNNNSQLRFKRCSFCNNSFHKIYTCMKFRDLPLRQKSDFVYQNKLCVNCLGSKHHVRDCSSQLACSSCGKKHHSLLHSPTPQSSGSDWRHPGNSQRNYNDTPNPQVSCSPYEQRNDVQPSCSANPSSGPSRNHQQQDASATNNQTSLAVFAHDDNEVLLATALVNILAKNGQSVPARAIIDPGSTISIMTESLLGRLQLTPDIQNVQISGIGGNVEHSNKVISLKISSTLSPFSMNVNCCILNKITELSPHYRINKNMLQIPPSIELADPTFNRPSCIDMLLGADVYYKILSGHIVPVNEQSLTLVGTHFGYLISGLIPSHAIFNRPHANNSCFLVQGQNEEPRLDYLLEKFWSIENFSNPVGMQVTPEELAVESNFCNNTIVLTDHSFQVNLPLKTPREHFMLGESFYLAKKRFFNLEKRLEKDAALHTQYKAFIDEYISLNHARVVPLSLKNEKLENKYFLPHHCVLRESSQTTKLRVVFDGSMKTSTGLSLNDVMHKGMTVQPELFDILLRFRSFKYVLTADIEKMYRQIRVNPNQTYLQNILWRESPASKLQCIELLTVTYGTNCAPYLATRVLKELALTHKSKYPLASAAILSQCYVDDILCGQNSIDDLVALYFELIELCKLGHFNLHKWCSNSSVFLEKIKLSLTPPQLSKDYNIKIEGISNKVLGNRWNSELDMFYINVPTISIQQILTKRLVLSNIAQMFDPLGLIGPVIVIAKIIMQEIWKLKHGWDDPITGTMLNDCTDYFQTISKLNSLKIPRYILFSRDFRFCEIHGFSDASRKAYGACLYIRAFYPDNTVSCHLITSKSRIAPIKELTIPRLELCGALLLANLTARILSILENRFSFQSVNLWTDSEIVLCWLNSQPSRFNVFIANRISQIQSLSQDWKWRHIKSKDNPADYLSRGLKPDELINSSVWWHGPQFLQYPEVNLNLFDFKNSTTAEETKKVNTVLLTSINNFWELLFKRFSKYTRLQRTLAYILRFVHNIRAQVIKRAGPLSLDELKKAELLILKSIQSQAFSTIFLHLSKSPNVKIANKQILKLNPFIDSDNLIRVGGRLSQALIPYDHKYPILLPSNNKVVNLLLQKEHLRLGHVGPQTLLSNIRLRYWPLNGLREIKKISINCLNCFKFKARTFQQIMSDLPKERVVPSRPFSKVGVDFGGPFFIKASNLRRAKVEKGYIALFVCMATKAVHIELVSSLSTQAFLACLKRFIARRGLPTTIFSDHGTNFLGANNQIRELYSMLSSKATQNDIHNFSSSYEIQWKFSPPQSPHWGGLWEAAIKSTKHHIKRVIGDQQLTFEEFATILTQIEAILNSRPLQPLSDDPSDLNCLTPGHFLIGAPLTSYPDRDHCNISKNRLDRWQKCIQIQQLFWKRWIKEYLNNLQNRPKWLSKKRNIKVNEVVLLKENNTRPLEWPLARVLEVIPSKDGHVRLTKIKTSKGIYVRNITKLCPLPQLED